MALPEEYVAVIRQHFEKFRPQACPVCGQRQWAIDMVSASLVVDPPPETASARVSMGPGSFPAVSLVCTTCFYLRQFALIPILRAAGRV